MYGARLFAALVASLIAHGVTVRLLDGLPAQPPPLRPVKVEVRVEKLPEPEPEPPPEPEKPKEPEPVPTPPKQVVHEVPEETPRKRVKPQKESPPDAKPRKDPPPTERPATSGETTDTPTFGVSMESTTQAGSGPAVPVGNTLQVPQKDAPPTPGKVKPLAAPTAVHEVTKMPVMQGRCQGRYTDDAREAGIEGTVVLDLVVNPDGSTREIQVVQGLGHGLDEAAKAALRTCKFTPGERNGEKVAVRIRSFKIRFFLADE